MKKQTHRLLIMLLACWGTHAFAVETTKRPIAKPTEITTQNHRQKMPLSQRKAAALRLKASFVDAQKKVLDTCVKKHGCVKKGGQL